MVESKSKITHAIFDCRDCGKTWQEYTTARQNAYRHAKKTGHFVTGEIGRFYHYNSK
jgi:hypothetical protein